MTTHDFEVEVRERARAKYGFYKHLAVFLVINLMLFVINMVTSPGTWWSVWPLIGWGVAIVIHAARVFVFDAGEEEIVDRLVERERRRDEGGRR